MANAPSKSAAFPLTATFLVLALAIGGAGTRYPLLEMAVEAASIIVILYFALARHGRTLSPGGPVVLALVGLVILVPLVQLVPLPPSLWHELPGRQRAIEVLGLIGRSEAWMPISLDPEATRRSALATLPGIAMLIAAIHLSLQERIKLAYILVAFAILGATLGALQIATGGGAAVNPFDTGHRAHGVGLFTNRNHQADFLLIAIALAAAIGRIRSLEKPSSPARMLVVGMIALFAAGILATASRTGTVLLVLVALPAALILLFRVRVRWRTVGIGIVGLAVIGLFALNNSVVQAVIARFAADDPRFDYWRDTLVVIREQFPVGSGLGTFVPLHQSVETLSTVGASHVNHAHNDYLDLALEGGIPALVALLAFSLFVGMSARRLIRESMDRSERVLGASALLGIVVILLHSLVDYPLRMLSLMTVFGLLCALLVGPPVMSDARANGEWLQRISAYKLRRGLTMLGGLMVATALLAQVVMFGRVDHAVRGRVTASVATTAPWSASAASLAAVESLSAGDLDQARALAMKALMEAPLDVRSMSTLALVFEQQGRALDAARLMNVAASGGWRDPVTQLWLMNRAIQLNEYDVAAQRADALLRQGLFRDQLIALLRDISATPAAAAAIAQRLADNPSWRSAFMSGLKDLTTPQLAAHEAILVSLTDTGSPVTEVEAAAHVARLLEAGEYRRARAIWTRFAAPNEDRDSLLNDGGFEGLQSTDLKSPLVPFQWAEGGALDTSVRVGTPPEARSQSAIQVRSRNAATGVVLKQTLVLYPGAYRMSFLMKARDAPSLTGFEWSLFCLPGVKAAPAVQVAQSQTTAGWTRIEQTVRVSDECPAQELQLNATGLTPSATEAWLDDVAIRPIAASH